jgi:lysophospholipase L1-like esterase
MCFPGKNYVNKGYSGDTSADMLARFQKDVVSNHTRVVQIWSGKNDIENSLLMRDLQKNIEAWCNRQKPPVKES